MKAIITAGGHATRLRPITWNRNKHLIPLAGKPLLAYAISKIVAAGITDIGININPGDHDIPKVFGNGAQYGCRITYIEQQGGALGLAHIIKNAWQQGYLQREPFLMYLGDNILMGSISRFVERFKNERLHCMLALAKVPQPERFGVPEIVDGRIVRVEEKPAVPKSPYAVTGIYLYDEHAIDALATITPSPRGEYEITAIHQYYIDNGFTVGFEEITGWWKDTGKPEDLLIGNQFILDELCAVDALIHPTAHIDDNVQIQGKVAIGQRCHIARGTLIRGPVVIGNDTRIIGSYVGPYTSIGNNAELLDAHIEHSIVFDDVRVSCDTRIVDAILGAGAIIVRAADSLPQGHKLIIGDNSFVEL